MIVENFRRIQKTLVGRDVACLDSEIVVGEELFVRYKLKVLQNYIYSAKIEVRCGDLTIYIRVNYSNGIIEKVHFDM